MDRTQVIHGGDKVVIQSPLVVEKYIGDGSVTLDYDDLKNKPTIGGVTLEGDLSFEDLGLVEMSNMELLEIFNSVI